MSPEERAPSSAPGPRRTAAPAPVHAGQWLRALALAVAVGCAGASALAGNPPDLEARVKAAYVFHLLKYVEWPAPLSGGIHLCIAGSDEVADLLPELAGKSVRDLPLVVEPASGVPLHCQVLFVARSEGRWPELQAALRGRDVLTVSDIEGFTGSGGMVGFTLDGGHVHLDVNPDATRQTSLKISAKLLELARTSR